MTTVVISDLHLGSKYSMVQEFLAFLDGLPAGAELVLNGDTVDRWQSRLPARHLEVLDRLRAESERRRVIWLPGNHDDRYTLPDPRRIEFLPAYRLERRLFVGHGYDFDNVMPYHRAFILFFRLLHRLRILLGAESVHVAMYAKRFPRLYRVLRDHVAMNAIEYARENGYACVACGHTHFVEERVAGAVRYLNTGSWTERPLACVRADDDTVRLERLEG